MTYLLVVKATVWVGLSIYGYFLDAKSLKNLKLYSNPNGTKVTPNLENKQSSPDYGFKKKKKRRGLNHNFEEASLSPDIENIENIENNKNEIHESIAEPTEMSPVPLRKRRHKSTALRNSTDALTLITLT